MVKRNIYDIEQNAPDWNKENLSKRRWRTATIIFIVLFILSWITFSSIIYIGYHEAKLDTDCMNYCAEQEAESYIYSPDFDMCSCLNGGEVSIQKEIK